MVRGRLETKGVWGYSGKNPVRRRRRKDPAEDAQFQPGTNHFWIRLASDNEAQAATVWIFENNSPGKQNYQTQCGDFLVRLVEFKTFATIQEASEAGYGMYPGHWTLHKFIICW